MNRMIMWLAAYAVGMTLLVGGLGLAHWRLSSRVAALEVVAAQQVLDRATPEASTVQALQTAAAAWRDAQAGEAGSLPQEEAAELVQVALDRALETTLDDALEQRAAAREQERRQRFLSVAEQGIEVQLEELALDYDLTEAQTAQAGEVLLSTLQDGMELRRAVGNGEVSLLEARAEGQLLREGLADSLQDTLGADAYEDLGRRFHGEGGWEAAGRRGLQGMRGLLGP